MSHSTIPSSLQYRSRRPQPSQLPQINTHLQPQYYPPPVPAPPPSLPNLPTPPPYYTEYYSGFQPTRPTSCQPPPKYQTSNHGNQGQGSYVPYTVTYASRHNPRTSCPPHPIASRYTWDPPAAWTQQNYVPFGAMQRPPSPSPPPPPPKEPIRSPKRSTSNPLVDEIAALVQAEIDDIERELRNRSGESPMSPVSPIVQRKQSIFDTSASLLAPFSYDVPYFFDDASESPVEVPAVSYEPQELEASESPSSASQSGKKKTAEEVSRRISSGSTSSAKSINSNFSASTAKTSPNSSPQQAVIEKFSHLKRVELTDAPMPEDLEDEIPVTKPKSPITRKPSPSMPILESQTRPQIDLSKMITSRIELPELYRLNLNFAPPKLDVAKYTQLEQPPKSRKPVVTQVDPSGSPLRSAKSVRAHVSNTSIDSPILPPALFTMEDSVLLPNTPGASPKINPSDPPASQIVPNGATSDINSLTSATSPENVSPRSLPRTSTSSVPVLDISAPSPSSDNSTSQTSTPQSQVDNPNLLGGLGLFTQIRRTLTFKDTVWSDLDEELDNEEYTDEFEEVVAVLRDEEGTLGLGLEVEGLKRGNSARGLKLARSVRVGTVRGGRGAMRKGARAVGGRKVARRKVVREGGFLGGGLIGGELIGGELIGGELDRLNGLFGQGKSMAPGEKPRRLPIVKDDVEVNRDTSAMNYT
ncbi:hypothetical protein BZA77DRAFT_374462 [Pyronema omphalodes]|nr:hypothetical protein BZA77DRAFT_374462 [Pyronema omphalodes]